MYYFTYLGEGLCTIIGQSKHEWKLSIISDVSKFLIGLQGRELCQSQSLHFVNSTLDYKESFTFYVVGQACQTLQFFVERF